MEHKGVPDGNSELVDLGVEVGPSRVVGLVLQTFALVEVARLKMRKQLQTCAQRKFGLLNYRSRSSRSSRIVRKT